MTLQNVRQDEPYARPFGALTDETRRQIIRTLRGRAGAVSEQELAERLAATASDSESEEAASDAVESLRVQLWHLHLPKLADGGFVDWDKDSRTVAATDHPVYDTPETRERLPTDGQDSVISALADERRREVLAIVESENGLVTRSDLARELASAEADGEPAETLVEDVTVQLHHHHLPKLEQAGLIEYNLDDATVAYRGLPERTTVLPGSASAN